MKEGREWIGVSDLMSGLMMIFLFIAVAYMVEIREEQLMIERIALSYEQTQSALHEELLQEFSKDLSRWKAEIRDDNTIIFYAPEVLFKTGSSAITSRFQKILDAFFPRYFRVIQRYRRAIDEVRIEGHTSSDWAASHSERERYLNNMRLSQERSLQVLEYCYSVADETMQPRFRQLVHANGMADSRPVLRRDGSIDAKRSRRVEFRTVTRAKERIEHILRQINKVE
jgi:outer membrane protein OmpA-like peptidoglycan-associated protein